MKTKAPANTAWVIVITRPKGSNGLKITATGYAMDHVNSIPDCRKVTRMSQRRRPLAGGVPLPLDSAVFAPAFYPRYLLRCRTRFSSFSEMPQPH